MDKQEAPQATNRLPDALRAHFDGTQLDAAMGEAIRLSTVSAEGWPHGAQLSVGEILAVDASELLIAIWPQSNTTANLRRDGRLTLSLVHDGAMLEIRGEARELADPPLDLAVFRVRLVSVDVHRAKYADVLNGVTYRLHEPESVLARWRAQIAALRSIV
ncbi:pyridoxamine 5'-phosphate oxidase family protein [Paraburkholderia sp. J94]|uniref:pyridoxamine 5'-phosphate oxidase family protein n=1 Tax=Paraburkholderia sp. J94 TaxID=2805441 RepID=UPI002AB189F7|nr:pyridoxamine 5'-phosphate oxidase family protein [Paraburkholderia sp. J94]